MLLAHLDQRSHLVRMGEEGGVVWCFVVQRARSSLYRRSDGPCACANEGHWQSRFSTTSIAPDKVQAGALHNDVLLTSTLSLNCNLFQMPALSLYI
jgi:hypothetical protein